MNWQQKRLWQQRFMLRIKGCWLWKYLLGERTSVSHAKGASTQTKGYESIQWRNKQGTVSPLARGIVSRLQGHQMTAYETSIWSLAHASTTLLDRPDLRVALQSLITLASYTSPAIVEAYQKNRADFASLDEDSVGEHVIRLVNGLLLPADTIIAQLSDEDYQLVLNIELKHRLQALHNQTLTTEELALTCAQFGEHHYLEARSDVEVLLTHADPSVRRRALETLMIHWGLPNYTEIAFQYIEDPDPGCRKTGLRCLNPRGEQLLDLRVLRAYAKRVADPHEIASLRFFAYEELLLALDFWIDEDKWQQDELFLQKGGKLEEILVIHWDLIHFFLKDHAPSLSTTIIFNSERQTWTDQYGRTFCRLGDIAHICLANGHIMADALLNGTYTLTISFAPTIPPPETDIHLSLSSVGE